MACRAQGTCVPVAEFTRGLYLPTGILPLNQCMKKDKKDDCGFIYEELHLKIQFNKPVQKDKGFLSYC